MAEIITIPSNSIIYDIDLEMHSQGHWDDVYTKQYDTNTRYIRATVWLNGNIFPVTADKTITFSCTKPKTGYGIDNIAGIDSEGRIVYRLTDQTSVEEGNFKAEFRIYSTDVVGGATISKRETTFDFKMHVAKSALNDATVISSNEFNILTQNITLLGDLIADANEALLKITNIVATEEARVIAEANRIAAENLRISKDATRPDYIYLTQAQWDLLPDEFQNDPDIIYEITDDDGIFPTELQNLINNTTAAKVAAENVVLQKNGINDATINTVETWSSDKITKRIRTSSFTASGTATNIIHNLSYNPTNDDLLVIYNGLLLEKSINYSENANNISVDLIGWSILTGEKFYFKLYKNVK